MKINTEFPKVVTASLDVDGCEYRWFITRVFNLRQAPSYNRNLNFGAGLADAIYAARKAFYIDKTSALEAKQRAEYVVDTEFSVAFSKEMLARKTKNKDVEKIKTPERLLNLIALYFKKFPLNQETIAPFLLNDSLSAEQALTIPLVEDVTLAIKPDMLAVDLINDTTTILDEKTIGNLAKETRWNEYMYMLRTQFNLYARALQILVASGKLPVPPVKVFEVRRAIINNSISSNQDRCEKLAFSIDTPLVADVFYHFKDTIHLRLLRFNEITGKYPEILELHPLNVLNKVRALFPRNYELCYQYGELCPLAQHCARNKDLVSLGYGVSKINTVTKEIEFLK